MIAAAYPSHGVCWLWDAWLIAAMVTGDAAIALAYGIIPFGLWRAAVRRRRARRAVWPLYSFGAFIVACGLTHVAKIAVIWFPWFWAEATVGLLCASASIATVAAMFSRRRYAEVAEAIVHFEDRIDRADRMRDGR